MCEFAGGPIHPYSISHVHVHHFQLKIMLSLLPPSSSHSREAGQNSIFMASSSSLLSLLVEMGAYQGKKRRIHTFGVSSVSNVPGIFIHCPCHV